MSASLAVASDVYRWTGPDGTPHFGDRPPTGADSERIEVRAPMGALPLPDAEEILRRPLRPVTEEPVGAPEAPTVEADPDEPDPVTRDRRSFRGR
ncbi:DUF4124 domain-containing protein [Thioalkalivibrio nitratireducens]|uniref:DUF4124 domain-containing protein n=1 Tax=Thioalkalivibrio nitratireducens TaxID=186931 RepID=UPI001F3C706B|nr:DUF4124 domain-containing protein [Thioalkalivibrio nitratireducens]